MKYIRVKRMLEFASEYFSKERKESIKMWLKIDSSYTLMWRIWRTLALLFLLPSMFQIFNNTGGDWATQKAFLWGWQWLCDLGQGLNTSKPFLICDMNNKSINLSSPPTFTMKSELWAIHAQRSVGLTRQLGSTEVRVDKLECPSHSP